MKAPGKIDGDVQFRERSGSRSHRSHLSSSTSSSTPEKSPLSVVPALGDDFRQYVSLSESQGVVISGGDGYEDFKASALNLPDEDFSHDDTSSHLLIWETH